METEITSLASALNLVLETFFDTLSFILIELNDVVGQILSVFII